MKGNISIGSEDKNIDIFGGDHYFAYDRGLDCLEGLF
jgi:hypothetical protein